MTQTTAQQGMPEPLPANRRQGFDPHRLGRRISRLALPIVLVAGFYLFFNYGSLTVPAGMDTFPERCGPGSVCVVAKRPKTVKVGGLVFVDVEAGTALLEVAEVRPDGTLRMRVDNPASSFAWLTERQFTTADVRALVYAAFTPDAEPR